MNLFNEMTTSVWRPLASYLNEASTAISGFVPGMHLLDGNHEKESSLRRRRLQDFDLPGERNVDKSPGYCVPDSEGYFGAIGDGSYAKVKYGFGVETSKSADMDNIVGGVKGSIERYLITRLFPSVCGGGDELSGVSGFFFDPSIEMQNETLRSLNCELLLSEDNICDIFAGNIFIYGKLKPDVRPLISESLEAFNPENSDNFDKDLDRIFYVELNGDNFNPDVGGPTDTQNNMNNGGGGGGEGGGLSAGAIAGIVFGVLIAVFGVIAIVRMRRRRRPDPTVPDQSMQPNTLNLMESERASDVDSVRTEKTRNHSVTNEDASVGAKSATPGRDSDLLCDGLADNEHASTGTKSESSVFLQPDLLDDSENSATGGGLFSTPSDRDDIPAYF